MNRTTSSVNGARVPWPDGEVSTLDNGLRVVTGALSHLHTVAVGLYVAVGSRFETRETNGVCHLVEHVLFRGCAGYPDAYAFNSAIESCSHGLGGSTYRDFTVYDTTCHPRDLARTMTLIGTFAREPLFVDIDTERKVITQELRDELDEAGRDMDPDNLAKRALYGERGLGLPIGGRIKVVQRLTEQDCRDWFERFYAARNMVLAVAGPVEHAAVVELAAEAFGEIPPGEEAVYEPPEVVAEALPAIAHRRSRGSQTSLQLSWALPGEEHEDWPALYVASRILDDGTCARLRHRIVDEMGLAYDLGADLETHVGVALLNVDATVSHDSAVPVAEEVLAVIASLGEEPPGQEEWDRFRRRYVLAWDGLVDSPEAVAGWLGLQELHPPGDTLERRFDQVMAVTPEAMVEAVRRHIRPDRLQIAVVGDLEPIQRAALRRRIHRLRVGP